MCVENECVHDTWLAATFFCAPSYSFYLGFIVCIAMSKVINFQVTTVLSVLVMKAFALQNIRQLVFFLCHHGRVYGAILLSARLVSTSFSPRELVIILTQLVVSTVCD